MTHWRRRVASWLRDLAEWLYPTPRFDQGVWQQFIDEAAYDRAEFMPQVGDTPTEGL